jgi:hypothetical protein
MSEYAHRDTGRGADPASDSGVAASGRTGAEPSMWVGWIWFAGVIMIMIGLFNVIEGLVALFHKVYYVVSPENLLVFNLSGWGWVHLIVGALVALAGIALFSGAAWARLVTVLLAAVNAVAQLAFVPVYPVWSTIVLTLCVVVIWAVVVHGGESRSGA